MRKLHDRAHQHCSHKTKHLFHVAADAAGIRPSSAPTTLACSLVRLSSAVVPRKSMVPLVSFPALLPMIGCRHLQSYPRLSLSAVTLARDAHTDGKSFSLTCSSSTHLRSHLATWQVSTAQGKVCLVAGAQLSWNLFFQVFWRRATVSRYTF